MKSDNKNALLVLDRQRQIIALEEGVGPAGLTGTDFDRVLYGAGHELDYKNWRFDGRENGPRWGRSATPKLEVTPDNIEEVRAAAEATIARRGLANTLMGRRRTAGKIIEKLNLVESGLSAD